MVFLLLTVFQDVRITASSCGRGLLILADSDGNVHLVNRNFEISTFRAYDRNITIVEQGRQSPLLVTIGASIQIFVFLDYAKQSKLMNPLT